MDLTDAQRYAFDALDLIGAFAFAVSGALAAVRRGFDVVGIAMLACCTAFGGGVVRDVLIGAVPPAAFEDLRYLATALVAAALITLWHPPPRLAGAPLDTADAVGLGLYCVTGTVKALEYGLGPVPAALMGVATAVGGGMLRDLLTARTPSVLRRDSEIYLVPALVGASATALLASVGAYSLWTATLAGLGAIALRLLALRFHLRAPLARGGHGRREE